MGIWRPLYGAVLVSRIFTVLAAILLVTSFGLLMLTPYDLPLLQGLAAVDPALVVRLHDSVVGILGHGAWTGVFMPVLARPAWLIPLGLGMICVGVATTMNVPPATHRTRRRS
jgi:hypothetical protein